MAFIQQKEAGRVGLTFSFGPPPPLEEWTHDRLSPVDLYNLRLLGEKISLQEGFDELLCLDTLKGVQPFWFQNETVKRVLKHFRGRVLLADEVGLGKTIEAGILLKEYLMRGLVERVLILTPPSLVSQWREELAEKFSLAFVTTEGGAYRSDPQHFWQDHPRIIASLGELDMILGNLNDERDFPDIVMDLWLRSAGEKELREGFARLGEELTRAKGQYLTSKELDEQLFGEEFEA